MSHIHAIISELDAYCAATGLSPATVCNRARNNARLYGRLKSKTAKLDDDIKALRAWMAANPASQRRVAE